MHSIQSHLIVTLLLLFGCSGSLALKGSVLLDSLNFDKILNRFSFSLIKFDIQYPYGEKHEIFGHVAENLKNNHEILVGEVNVQDFGEMENKDLADRFQLNKNDFPAVMLFRQDDFSRPIRFDPKETFTIDKIKQFVKKETGLRMVLDGCIPELDQLAEMFGQDEIDRQTREQLLQDATRQVDKLNENLHKSGQVYVKIMQKILDKGHDFVQSESERVSKILREKLSPIKKKDLEGKLNILQSFAKQLVQSSKVEL